MRGTGILVNRRTLVSGSVAASLALLGLAVAAPASAATSYTVSTTADSSVSAGACGNTGITAAPSPLSLREATCLANNVGGAVTINIPAGTYVLANGELQPGQAAGSNITMAGAGAGATVITANNASRVIDLDKNLVGGVSTTISGVTVTGGADSTFGGAGIIGGSGNASTIDSLTLSNVIVTGNAANGAAPGVTNKPGGGIQFFGGKLSISDSTISNNSSASSYGSGLAYGAEGAASPESLTVTNTTFSGNNTANTHGDTGTEIGGALATFGVGSSSYSVSNSRFVNNTSTSVNGSGPAVGAAIWDQSGNLNVTGSTFTGNSVSGGTAGDTGGAVEVTGGSATLHYNRFVGNTAPSGSALHSGGTVDATDNWFGCNTGPGTAGCDTVTGSATVSPRLVLTATANPATVIGPNGTSTITASFTTDSAGATQNGSNFGAFATLPVTFSDPPGDATVTAAAGSHTANFSNGVASIDYHSGASTVGPDPDSITFDNATVSTIVTVDQAPAITSANTTNFTAGTAGSFTVTSTGYPAATISETGALPAGLTFTSNGNGTATLAGTATGPGGSFPLAITANNGVSPNATQAFTLTVGGPPSITSANAASFIVGTAGSFTVTTTGSPTAAITESGTLPAGVTFTDNGDGTATLAGTPTGPAGSFPVTVTANNGTSPNATQTLTITVRQAPVITSGNSASFSTGSAGSFTITSTGSPTPAITETGTLPAGVTFTDNGDGTATLAGTATGPGGSFPLAITANNGVSPNATQAFTLTVGGPPSITSANAASFIVGTAGSFTVTTSGSPTAAISESGALPAGVTFTDNGDGTATLAGTPTGPAGSFPVTVTANNGTSPNATQTLTITVRQAPVITSTNSAHFVIGVAGSFTVTSTGSPTPAITETGTLPAGVTFTDNGDGTATLAGTATGPGGGFPLSIAANNGVAPNATQILTITVTGAPSITSPNSATFSAGTAGSFTVTTSGSPTAAISESGALPAGVTFTDNGDGTATLAGTPTGPAGSFPVTVTANNGTSPDATQNLSIRVNEAPSAPTGVSGTADGSTAQVSWTAPSFTGGAPITSYTVVGTDTATSATVTDTVTGNPPVTTAAVGGLVTGHSYTFTVTATNAENLTSPPSAPSAPVSAGSPATISGTPPSGMVGSAYSFAFSTTGSPAPTVTVTDGSLPTGLTLSSAGVLSGTPTVAGSFGFTVTAHNSIGPDASDATTVFISAVVPGAPTGVSAVAGNASATVSWTPPSFTGGSPILTYTVTGTDLSHSAPNVTALASGAPVPTSVTVSGLTPGDSYVFTVVATNTAGSSAPSAPSGPVTPFSPPTISGTPGPATAGVGYSFTFATTGSPAPTVTATGTLPAGLTLASNGTLSGIPTTAGSYSFTVSAANGHAPNASRAVSVTVSPGAASTVTATAGMNQAATAGQPFADRLAATVADAYANPVPSVNVTFAVTSGTATFPGGAKTVIVATNSAGLATAPVLTAGKTAGPVTVTASAGSAVPATFNETVLSVSSARADLVVTLSAPASAAKGSTFAVTVTVKNRGPNSASLLLTTLNLGCGLSVVSAPGGSTFGGSVLYSASGLASNASLTYTVTVKAGRNAFNTGLFAGALSIVPDPVLSNNLAAAKLKIT